MSNEQKVWLSFPDSSTNIYSIGMNIPGLFDQLAYQECNLEFCRNTEDEEIRKKNKELGAYGLDIENAVQRFKKFPVLPDGLWLERNMDSQPKESEYIFQILGGAVILNQACANIFKQFNLGETTLTPVKIHKPLSHELWRDETYYFLNLCEKRQFVRKQQHHERLEYYEYSPDNWKYTNNSFGLNVDYVEIDKSAIDCDVDLWHDPRLVYESYFLSDALYGALLEAGFADAWSAGSCKLI